MLAKKMLGTLLAKARRNKELALYATLGATFESKLEDSELQIIFDSSSYYEEATRSNNKQLLESYKNPIAVFQGHYHAAKITQHDNVLYVASPALVSYPNAFRVININNYKDKVVFDFEWKETRETTIQKFETMRKFRRRT